MGWQIQAKAWVGFKIHPANGHCTHLKQNKERRFNTNRSAWNIYKLAGVMCARIFMRNLILAWGQAAATASNNISINHEVGQPPADLVLLFNWTR